MKYHILNGDALKMQFEKTALEGEAYIIRECLIEGDVSSNSLHKLWKLRAEYLKKTYNVSLQEYAEKTKSEFEAISKITENASVYLWFERDLFCQLNLWFTVYFISEKLGYENHYLFLVLPNHYEWTGFGKMRTDELMHTFEQKIQLRKDDIRLFKDLWIAYAQNDHAELKQLSLLMKDRYPYLPEVVQAHLDRFPEEAKRSRPETATLQIIQELQTNDFGRVFRAFSEREGIYGFGDLQFRQIYERVMKENPDL
ncbi:hypothetical protein OKW21_002699 [Catalinimonas alkaloidigena]|uniref:DUF1835 domain-containing protein n=1 Tax=Catalinimonas alkaloidigena TaxID=1075417 RepID=UPI0024055ED7|nr:DUF1835 domain-containing protein [Catalinimonas alkaloidigena]MDF9797436.1 hypothetical protein [Catalinimonas alkaloidigena]